MPSPQNPHDYLRDNRRLYLPRAFSNCCSPFGRCGAAHHTGPETMEAAELMARYASACQIHDHGQVAAYSQPRCTLDLRRQNRVVANGGTPLPRGFKIRPRRGNYPDARGVRIGVGPCAPCHGH